MRFTKFRFAIGSEIKADGTSVKSVYFEPIAYTITYDLIYPEAYIQMRDGGTQYTGTQYSYYTYSGHDDYDRIPMPDKVYGKQLIGWDFYDETGRMYYEWRRGYSVSAPMIPSVGTNITARAVYAEDDADRWLVWYVLCAEDLSVLSNAIDIGDITFEALLRDF